MGWIFVVDAVAERVILFALFALVVMPSVLE